MKETAQLFKALADETRLRILALLLAEEELCVCHLMASLQLPQSTASRHLAYLKNSGLLTDRREGVWIYYSINRNAELLPGMLELLRAHVATLPTATEDAQRLALCLKGKSCV